MPLPMPLRAVPVPRFMPMHACVQQMIVETKDNKWGSEDTKCDNKYRRNRKIEALID